MRHDKFYSKPNEFTKVMCKNNQCTAQILIVNNNEVSKDRHTENGCLLFATK